MPFGLQPTHLILILVVALLVFGPSRLPEIGRSFGSMLREFQTATKEVTQSLQQEITAPPVKKEEPATVACKSCGKGIQRGAKFCPECGASQIDAPPAPPAASMPSVVAEPSAPPAASTPSVVAEASAPPAEPAQPSA